MNRVAKARTEKEKREIFDKWHKLINMSQRALNAWAENDHRLLASINREEAKDEGGIQSGYDSFHRIKRRKSKPFDEWSAEDFDNASQENGFNSRMLGNEPGDTIGESGMSKWEISLRNWGHDPSLKSSPAYSKWKAWKQPKKSASIQRVASRYYYRSVSLEASRWAVSNSPNMRVSSVVTREIDARVLSVFGEGMLRQAQDKTALVKMIGKKLKELYLAFQKAPKMWEKFKELLGISSTNPVTLYFELSKKFQNLLDEGAKWWKSVKSKLRKDSKILHFIFLYASNAPTLTSVVKNIIDRNGGKDGALNRWLSKSVSNIAGKAKNVSQWLDDFMSKHPLLKIITMPAKAYIYWAIWTNVTEISWNVAELLKGFLGMISWTDLIESLPESGIGFLISMLFPMIPGGWISKSLKIGWNAILIPAVGLQLYALYTKGLVDEKGQPV